MLQHLVENYDDVLLYIKISVLDPCYHLATKNGNKRKIYRSNLPQKVKYYGIGIIYKLKKSSVSMAHQTDIYLVYKV